MSRKKIKVTRLIIIARQSGFKKIYKNIIKERMKGKKRRFQ